MIVLYSRTRSTDNQHVVYVFSLITERDCDPPVGLWTVDRKYDLGTGHGQTDKILKIKISYANFKQDRQSYWIFTDHCLPVHNF